MLPCVQYDNCQTHPWRSDDNRRGGGGGEQMRCERCGADRHVEVLMVDGFVGRLCDTCYDQWMKILESGEAVQW